MCMCVLEVPMNETRGERKGEEVCKGSIVKLKSEKILLEWCPLEFKIRLRAS